MARSKIPDPLTRRHLLEKSLDPAAAMRTADAYLEQGRVLEAVAFLEKADARERLEALREEAIAAGDFFLVKLLADALGIEASGEDGERTGAAAEAAGKLRYASAARRQLDRGRD